MAEVIYVYRRLYLYEFALCIHLVFQAIHTFLYLLQMVLEVRYMPLGGLVHLPSNITQRVIVSVIKTR